VPDSLQGILVVKKQVEDNAWPLLMQAEKFLKEGKYEKAIQKTASAGRWVKWGTDARPHPQSLDARLPNASAPARLTSL